MKTLNLCNPLELVLLQRVGLRTSMVGRKLLKEMLISRGFVISEGCDIHERLGISEDFGP